MNTITHALLPVIGIAVDKKWNNSHRANFWSRGRVIAVALMGAMPDLLNPHISLAARYTSWSHGLPAVGLMTVILFAICAVRKFGIPFYHGVWMFGAYIFHLFCDMISGGIAWWYPFGSSVVGGYFVPAILWFPMDFLCLIVVYLVYRAIPNYLKSKCREV